MNLTNYYYYWANVIPHRICDMIIQYGKALKSNVAITGGLGRDRDLKAQPLTKKELKDLKKKRDSNICWFNDRWIYKEIQPYVHQANALAGWNFEWDKPYAEEGPTKGKIRKLSLTVSLSDPQDYKGGELQFDFRQNDPDKKREIRTCTEILPKGSLVVFPSFVWHRVKPITKGVRYSLVNWNLGWPFK